MAKKKNKTQIPVRKEAVKSACNLAGTPRGEELVRELTNPFVKNIVYSLLTIIVSAIMIWYPLYSNTDLNEGSPVMIFFYLGLVVCALGIGYLISFIKKSFRFAAFKRKKDHLIIWENKPEEYDVFIKDMDMLVQRPSKRQVIVTAICLAVLEIVMFFMSPSDGRWVVFLSTIILFGSIFGIMFFAPRYYMTNIRRKPYCSIIDLDEAYMMGTYINWKYGTGEIKRFPDTCKTTLCALCIDYDGYRMGSKMVLQYTALLPVNDEATIDEAERVGKEITRCSKERAEFDQSRGDFLTCFFRKSVGRDVPEFEYKEKKS